MAVPPSGASAEPVGRPSKKTKLPVAARRHCPTASPTRPAESPAPPTGARSTGVAAPTSDKSTPEYTHSGPDTAS
ncbi:hypothetical protein OH77DRAFT_1329958 [Trametes cingulata]|nr:hypothetical protein OH77DRAFT_1329958 [Trametes cingulata]